MILLIDKFSYIPSLKIFFYQNIALNRKSQTILYIEIFLLAAAIH